MTENVFRIEITEGNWKYRLNQVTGALTAQNKEATPHSDVLGCGVRSQAWYIADSSAARTVDGSNGR